MENSVFNEGKWEFAVPTRQFLIDGKTYNTILFSSGHGTNGSGIARLTNKYASKYRIFFEEEGFSKEQYNQFLFDVVGKMRMIDFSNDLYNDKYYKSYCKRRFYQKGKRILFVAWHGLKRYCVTTYLHNDILYFYDITPYRRKIMLKRFADKYHFTAKTLRKELQNFENWDCTKHIGNVVIGQNGVVEYSVFDDNGKFLFKVKEGESLCQKMTDYVSIFPFMF